MGDLQRTGRIKTRFESLRADAILILFLHSKEGNSIGACKTEY
jgi:hypothetical protein